jgi:uncharacterized glyoxalase superfamily protein PhnB
MFSFKGASEMKITSYYPVIQTNEVAKTVNFYKEHFQFKALFETDWYVHLQSNNQPDVNLAILQFDHETVPETARKLTQGLILNFEVEDPDSVYNKAQAAKLPIVKSLRDEDFGQRHFITQDPNGVLIDVIEPIEASEEFSADYAEGAIGN